MTKLQKLRHSLRAISPVIAVLLMIAIAVVASLVAYAWIMGYIGFQTGKTGQAIQITSFAAGVDDNHLIVYVQNVGQGTAEVNSVFINDKAVDIESPPDLSIAKGATKELTVDLGTDSWNSGEKVKIKVTTDDGTFAEKTSYGSSGPTVTPTPTPPTVIRVSSVARTSIDLTGGTANFAVAPTEGNLLVVVAGHRVGDPFDNHEPTLAGYVLQEVEWHSAGSGDTSIRRIVAIFTKIAVAGESSSVSIDWHDSDLGSTDAGFVILQEFTGANSYVKVASGKAHNTAVSMGLTVPATQLSTTENNILAIGGIVYRDDDTKMTGVTFDNLGGSVFAAAPTTPGVSSVAGASAFHYAQGSATVLQTTATIVSTDPDLSGGLLVLFKCS